MHLVMLLLLSGVGTSRARPHVGRKARWQRRSPNGGNAPLASRTSRESRKGRLHVPLRSIAPTSWPPADRLGAPQEIVMLPPYFVLLLTVPPLSVAAPPFSLRCPAALGVWPALRSPRPPGLAPVRGVLDEQRNNLQKLLANIANAPLSALRGGGPLLRARGRPTTGTIQAGRRRQSCHLPS